MAHLVVRHALQSAPQSGRPHPSPPPMVASHRTGQEHRTDSAQERAVLPTVLTVRKHYLEIGGNAPYFLVATGRLSHLRMGYLDPAPRAIPCARQTAKPRTLFANSLPVTFPLARNGVFRPIIGGILSGYYLGSPTKGALIFGLRTSLPAIPVMHGRGDQGETPTRPIQSARLSRTRIGRAHDRAAI